ncbi:MAG TPA: polymer-forming cytoskeletal protein [Phototrophicaceae bacterium]|nr:polymer-forming cytoskeletal protein [Phototrophicaceae bacterium]
MSFFGNRRQAETAPTPAPPKPPVVTAQPPVGFETVLGANSTLEGHLRSNANVRLDGTFTGTLEISGNILVGETAQINADINAKNISIAGAVRGNVNGKKVQLLRTGRIWGDIRATALTTEEGAFIDGKITMISQQEDAPSAEGEDSAASLGATEDQPVDKPAETEDELTENISDGEADDLPVGGDWTEGQTNADFKDVPQDDQPRQST